LILLQIVIVWLKQFKASQKLEAKDVYQT